MGLFLSILYFVTYYLTPVTVFGPLAAYRIELILAVLAIGASLLSLGDSFVLKTSQIVALVGLGIATIASVLFGAHWLGGGVQAFLLFISQSIRVLSGLRTLQHQKEVVPPCGDASVRLPLCDRARSHRTAAPANR